MSETLVIYHGKCIDGFTAAWVCWREFGDGAEYHPGIYQEDPPDVTGKDVVIVDFSYKFDVMVDVVMAADSVLVLDHHKSAQEDLEGLAEATHKDKVNIVFDMDRCGAGIAWDYFFPEEERPWLINYVEDRDLWKWELPDSKAVSAYISSVEQTFENWDNMSAMNWLTAVERGQAAVRYIDRYVRKMCEQARYVEFKGYVVPVVNAPYINISELCGALAETDCIECEGKGETSSKLTGRDLVCGNCGGGGKTFFAVGWFQRGDGKYHYSLQSRGNFDVSQLASRYGGGGHRDAAGFVSEERVV